jgi:hypothetical protein
MELHGALAAPACGGFLRSDNPLVVWLERTEEHMRLLKCEVKYQVGTIALLRDFFLRPRARGSSP